MNKIKYLFFVKMFAVAFTLCFIGIKLSAVNIINEPGVTVSCESGGINNGCVAVNMVDGDYSTGCVPNLTPYRFNVDLGVSRKIYKIIWNSDRNNGYSLRTPVDYTISVSETGAFAGEETQVANVTGNSNGHLVTHTFEPVFARYIRMEVIAVPSTFEPWIDELEVYQSLNSEPDNLCLESGVTASAGTTPFMAGSPANLIDGINSSTSICCPQNAPYWFMIDLGAQKDINTVVFNCDKGENYTGRTPIDYKIMTSSTGSFTGEETVVADITGNGSSVNITHFFATHQARYVKILVTEVSLYAQPLLDEIEIYNWKRNPLPQPPINAPLTDVNLLFSEYRPDYFVSGTLPVSGSLYLYLENNGTTNVDIDDFELNYTSFQNLNESGNISWWRARPAVIESGKVGEVLIRFKQMPLASYMELISGDTVESEILLLKSGIKEKAVNVIFTPQEVAIEFAGFSDDLKTVYLYVKKSLYGTVQSDLHLANILVNNQAPQSLSYNSNVITEDILSVAVQLATPLEQGKPVSIILSTIEGHETGLNLRAFPSKFRYLVSVNAQEPQDWLSQIAAKSHTGIMMHVSELPDNIVYTQTDVDTIYANQATQKAQNIDNVGLDLALYGYPFHWACEEACIGELRVFSGGTNVALQGTATAKGAYSTILDVGNVNDDDTGSVWIGTKLAPDSWVQIDLGSVQSISSIQWDSSRGTNYSVRIPSDYTVSISSTGAFNGEETVVVNTTGNTENYKNYSFTSTSGQYVRMRITSTYPEFHIPVENFAKPPCIWISDEPFTLAKDGLSKNEQYTYLTSLGEKVLDMLPDTCHGLRVGPKDYGFSEIPDVRLDAEVDNYSRRPNVNIISVRYHNLDNRVNQQLPLPVWIQLRPQTPKEFRFQIFSQISEGGKGTWIWHYGTTSWGATEPALDGVVQMGLNDQDPLMISVWNEIAEVAVELRTVGDLIARSCPADNIASSNSSSVDVSTLISGTDTLLVFVKNTNEANLDSPYYLALYDYLLSGAPSPAVTTQSNVIITVDLPTGFTCQNVFTVNSKTGPKDISYVQNGNQLQITFAQIDYTELIGISGSTDIMDTLIDNYIRISGGDAANENFAAGSTVTTSGFFSGQPSGAVDGDHTTFCAFTGSPLWLQVDLGTYKRINRIVWNEGRNMNYSSRFPVDYKIEVSVTGQFNGEQTTVANITGNTVYEDVVVDFPAENARYVRMTVFSVSVLSEPLIDEIEIYNWE